MRRVLLAGASLLCWVGAAVADITPAIAELITQFETIATQAEAETADADQAFMVGDQDDGCTYLKDAAKDYASAAGILAQIKAEVEGGGSASDEPRPNQLERLDTLIAKYQKDEADTRDTLKIACE